MLYELTSGSLEKVEKTTFAKESILERNHLQAAVRDHIDVLDADLLVVAEEFGDFGLAQAELQPAHSVLDIGCGWGALICWAAS